MFSTFFFKNAIYEIPWKNNVQLDSAQMIIWSMSFACWIPEATDTHSKLQQWLHKPTPKLHYMLCCLPCDLLGFFWNIQTSNFKFQFQRFLTYLFADLVMHSIHERCTYTVFSTITPITNSSLTTNKASVFFFIVYILSYNKIKIIRVNHKLMCTINFQTLKHLNLPTQRQ